MKVLATDLDRTLLPNGRWEADPQAIELFNQLTEQQQTYVVYVTGRSLELTEQAIAEFGIRHPHVLIGDVGTTIREYAEGQWRFDEAWIAHVRAKSPRWDVAGIKSAVAGIDGLTEQPPENLNPFKQSYFVDHARSEAILAEVERQVQGRFDESAIYSFDSQSGEGLLDFLPQSANKQTALEFVADKLGLEKSAVVFCGDSGNDVFPLTAGFSGVLVRNADEQLVKSVQDAQAANPALRVYFAQGNFQGLSGYYTSGVIEGAYHYGLFTAAA
ncbi:HAD-IIB family hydrolase [Rhabdochromatium marinum]|uniref:HAD-IIB family hydrolase n=1 Tax=Rhabdochromatium marinum TaxID=48729 RepID=UPI001906026A|nr:HAD-IIB family hydrolase [Rhabdochromatium marinum]MBK1647831.1 HAD family hydrolase [Rhabdochromatium marinum]